MADKPFRETIAEQIQADNPTYIVKPFAGAKPEVQKTNVFVTQESITNFREKAAVTHELKVFLAVPGTQSAANETKLEAALDNVLMSIAQVFGAVWKTATRGTLFDDFMGYEITLDIHTENTYKRSA